MSSFINSLNQTRLPAHSPPYAVTQEASENKLLWFLSRQHGPEAFEQQTEAHLFLPCVRQTSTVRRTRTSLY
jgi:hypothetical protein